MIVAMEQNLEHMINPHMTVSLMYVEKVLSINQSINQLFCSNLQ